MSVIEAPVRESTTITIEPKPLQQRLQRMIDMLYEGRWCRDSVDERMAGFGPRHCALGMVGMVTTGDPTGHFSDEGGKLVALLEEAIPPEGRQRIMNKRTGTRINGGTIRYTGHIHGRVASYNNTVENDLEILAWYERALERTL